MQLNTPGHFHQAITALGMGIALLLVARRIVLGTASVGDVPMVQGAAGEIWGFGDSDGFLSPRFISSEKIPLNGGLYGIIIHHYKDPYSTTQYNGK